MTKADKKDEERKEQLETEALMDAEVEAATDCGPVSHKAEKKDKEKASIFVTGFAKTFSGSIGSGQRAL